MTGLRSLDRDFRGLQVTDFADHDDVRILSEERTQRRCKGHAALVVLLHLVHAWQADFHRVLGGRDIAGLVIEDAQRGIERHRLTRTSRPGYQHHAVRLVDSIQEQLLLVRLVAKLVDTQLGRAGVKDTQHDLFAEQGRQGTDTEIDLLALGQIELDATILWHALFRDIQLRHHLQARCDTLVQLHRRLGDALEQAIDTEAHPIIIFVGLEVDIRSTFADGIDQRLVYELDDRGVIAFGIHTGVATAAHVLVTGGDVQIAHALIVTSQTVAQRVVAGQPQVQGTADLILVDQDRLDHQVGLELDLIQLLGRIAGAHEQFAATLEQRQHLMPAQQFLADQLHRVLAGIKHRHIQQRHAEFHGVGSGHMRGAHQLLVSQPLRQWHLGVGRLGHRRAGEGLIQGTILDQPAGNAGDSDEVYVGNIH